MKIYSKRGLVGGGGGGGGREYVEHIHGLISFLQ